MIGEPIGGVHYDPQAAAANVKDAILRHLSALQSAKPALLLRDRYAKFRRFGVVEESASA